MPWGDTHTARIAAKVSEVRALLAEVNANMLGIPPRYKFVVENDGHRVTLKEIGEAGPDPVEIAFRAAFAAGKNDSDESGHSVEHFFSQFLKGNLDAG